MIHPIFNDHVVSSLQKKDYKKRPPSALIINRVKRSMNMRGYWKNSHSKTAFCSSYILGYSYSLFRDEYSAPSQSRETQI